MLTLIASLVTHGMMPISARNIARIDATSWVLIDLDASCKIGSAAAMKVTSSCNFPPELGQRELDRTIGTPDMTTVTATVQFEMWYQRKKHHFYVLI